MGFDASRGGLIAVEGIDGTGKSTLVARLAERLRARGGEVVTSKEPTDGPWGRILRRSATEGRLGPEEELEMFLKDRREHVRDLILPALGRGAVVILDRYYFSTIAYQSLRGLDAESIRARNEAFAPVPDLLVILDLAPEAAVARIEVRERGVGANHFEQVHQLARSREVFLGCAERYPAVNGAGSPVRALVVEASRPPEVIAGEVEAAWDRLRGRSGAGLG